MMNSLKNQKQFNTNIQMNANATNHTNKKICVICIIGMN